jgi:hypothetical protein
MTAPALHIFTDLSAAPVPRLREVGDGFEGVLSVGWVELYDTDPERFLLLAARAEAVAGLLMAKRVAERNVAASLRPPEWQCLGCGHRFPGRRPEDGKCADCTGGTA